MCEVSEVIPANGVVNLQCGDMRVTTSDRYTPPPGRVVEFRNEEIEKLQQLIADELGYELVGHRLELYALPRRGRAKSDH